MSVAAERARVVQEAMSWLKTPWHHHSRVKGAGVDCLQLLVAVYEAAGVCLPWAKKDDPYPIDCFLHEKESRYLPFVETFAHMIPGPPVEGVSGK